MATLTRRFALPLLALLLTAAALAAQGPDRNVRFGLPGPAKADPGQREAYLIARPQYVLSYNAEKHTANWACWQLTKADIGTAPRSPFEPDPKLPPGMAKVTSHVYDGCGFDRGHLCPAHDRSGSPEDIRATFYMTNIVPQSPASNQHGWERLEDYCRRLAKEGHVLYIACGPAGAGGAGKDGRKEEIGKGRLKVAVPHKLWKVVLVLPREDAEPRKNSRVIAVIMPNDQTVGFDWARYRVSTRQVEKLTGLRFFSAVPKDVARALREHVDDVEVRNPAPRGGKKRGPE
ncbi:MAG TPA: DNA/RNA non-specific endonuclease [Gemmataceae bacterium]|jgi:endonuclease G|nr:DNA/RNA non-specific endonuclease [Gemmataceae bacterium]